MDSQGVPEQKRIKGRKGCSATVLLMSCLAEIARRPSSVQSVKSISSLSALLVIIRYSLSIKETKQKRSVGIKYKRSLHSISSALGTADDVSGHADSEPIPEASWFPVLGGLAMGFRDRKYDASRPHRPASLDLPPYSAYIMIKPSYSHALFSTPPTQPFDVPYPSKFNIRIHSAYWLP